MSFLLHQLSMNLSIEEKALLTQLSFLVASVSAHLSCLVEYWPLVVHSPYIG